MSLTLNGQTINVTRFPDNTTQVWKLSESQITTEAVIEWKYSSESELIEIAQLKDLLEAYGVNDIDLYIDYLPFARQDKAVTNVSTFALRSFAKLLNALEFSSIWIMDPHSSVALEVINNSRATYPHGALRQALQDTNADLVCYPDRGAVEKYTRVYKFNQLYIYGNKVRDQETGHITSYNLVGISSENLIDKKILIVDDICDGGKTFEILSKDLHAGGAKDVNLFVTHGLFTKGLRPLLDAGISQIFTKEGEAICFLDGFAIKPLRVPGKVRDVVTSELFL